MPDAALILFIPLLPLVAFVVMGLFGRKYFRNSSGVISILLSAGSTALAAHTAHGYFFSYGKVNGTYQKILACSFEWLRFSPSLSIDLGILLDPISVMMLVVVTFISLMVHIYSFGYMKGDERLPTYYSFLGLFTFSMLGLILSGNIFQMYIFWELVGVSSFLLIGYYYQKPAAVAACKKAFIVTRFADLGFLLGIFILSFHGGTLDFTTLITKLTSPATPELTSAITSSFLGISALTWGLVLVFMGGAGKSAMFPLHIWLPDAMEGPTPVSALIHAATMVVAGVFLVARLFPIYAFAAPIALEIVGYVGAFSALLAAIIACTQTDIKRVLAYSTMSQIGFMMFALGVSGDTTDAGAGYTASMFHLFTHAMFKALLFLGAGTIIHFIHSNEMKDMGGLRKYLPVTHITFLIGCLAIAGIPPFAGFFSKEEILWAAYQNNTPMYWVALVTSGITSFYMFRLYFNIFWSKPAGIQHVQPGHSDEGGFSMILPLVLLGTGAAVAGFIPFGHFVSSSGNQVPTEFHLQFSIAPVGISLAAIGLAMWLYRKENRRPAKLANTFGGVYKSAFNRFYIDEIYVFITKNLLFNLVGRCAAWFDRTIVDGLVNATGNATLFISRAVKSFQSGKVQQYAIVFLAGLIGLAVLFIYVWK